MPQSKYGGIPVEDETPKAGVSKYGGIPVDDAPTEKQTPEAQPQTFGHGITEFAKQINPVSMITGAANMIAHPVDTARNIYSAQKNELTQVPKLVREGRYSEAAGHGMAGLVPMAGPAAAKIGEQIGGDDTHAPDPAGGIGAGAGLITSILAAPKVGEYTGKAFKGLARPLVKSALNLPGKAEAYGADPAGAILADTKGIRPSTIARTGQQQITKLSGDLDTAAANSTGMPSLKPARDILNRESASSAAANSEQTPREIARMSKQLTEVRPGFTGKTEFAPGANTPISFQRQAGMVPGPPRLIRGASPDPIVSVQQPATNFLGMKRQFNEDHIIANWNPAASTKHGLGVARQVYGAMADELNRTVPGAEAINGRIQGLIPGVKRAEDVSRNAGIMQKAMDRISRPTGALVPALIGKQMGGLPGLLAGLGVPEMISAPAVKMFGARGLNLAGRGLVSPVGKRLIQAPTLLRQNQ